MKNEKFASSWQVSMQKINLIAQSVLELSHRENADDNDDDNDDDDTHPGWIIVRVGRYSVADNKYRGGKAKTVLASFSKF